VHYPQTVLRLRVQQIVVQVQIQVHAVHDELGWMM
jgi:hypothetical protein